MKQYLAALLTLHRRCFAKVLRGMMRRLPVSYACRVMNMRQCMTGNDVRFGYDVKSGLYYAREQNHRHYFSVRMRGFKLYQNGLQTRGDDIGRSYMTDRLTFNTDDTVIDCGANYGDMYIYLKHRIDPAHYHTFEPDPDAFKCVQMNAPGAHHNPDALYHQTGEQDFYIAATHGDSSLEKPPDGHTRTVRIQTRTLDDYVAAHNIKRIKLLKIEAEGTEPEVLQGARRSLHMIDYIAVDGGAERGMHQDETLSRLVNILSQNGFEMVGIDIPAAMGRALFQRIR